MMRLKLLNTLSGWLVFAMSLFVYLCTLEPTVSFWDCGEFLTCAWKLEIGHQPGAPFFLILGKIFSLFAIDHSRIAIAINALSAVASALTILLLFHTIVMLLHKMAPYSASSFTSEIIILTGALIGSLACAFSDTFWFSAVEGEVYATSSFLTALVFWAMLKWEAETDLDSERANRWIMLIVYLMGISIGVHLLNLLSIPALVLIYYFKKYSFTRNGLIKALMVGFLLLGFTVFLFIPWTIRLLAWTDLLFVNILGFPFNSGALFFIFLLFGILVFILIKTRKNNQRVWHHVTLAAALLIIGYSSYALLLIRAHAGPAINMNNVDNPFSLMQYINREQYVKRPLIYGPYYNAPVVKYIEKFTFTPLNGKYQKTPVNPKCIYDKHSVTIFPRMSSSDPQDIAAYKKWTGLGERKPDFASNVYFFFRYQVGYMYFRYFMWNFAGRQTENQGTGDVMNGNWISGIPAIDELRLGDQSWYPKTLKENKGRNCYYLIPLLFGILGMISHYKIHRKDFTVVLAFFLLTGLAVVIYLNEIPQTPRERDYAVGGSFYVFCIWIGLGVNSIYNLLKQKVASGYAAVITISISVAVPLLLLVENFDDHNRSNRYVARDMAYNYLNSCAPNAILFTNADNDTYPLWYLQEVEGIRTDVRIILAPYLNADWYINQLSRWQNSARPVKTSIEMADYSSGKFNYVPFYKRTRDSANLTDVIEFIKSEDSRAKVRLRDGSEMNYYPTNKFILHVSDDSEPVVFTVSDKLLYKNSLAILDILACNVQERPVYFISTQVPDQLGLSDYLQLDGFAYRLVPEKTGQEGYINTGRIDADSLYFKMMHLFKWGNMQDPKVFMDSNGIRNTSTMAVRNTFARLAEELILKHEPAKAIEVLDHCMEILPHSAVPYDAYILRIIAAYHNAGAQNKATTLSEEFGNILMDERKYYQSFRSSQAKALQYEISLNRYILEELKEIKTKTSM